MNDSLSVKMAQVLATIAGILLRCFFISLVALTFLWLVLLVSGDALFQVYGIFFDISRKEYDLFVLYSFTFIKSLNVVFFLFPFVAIKHYLHGKSVGH